VKDLGVQIEAGDMIVISEEVKGAQGFGQVHFETLGGRKTALVNFTGNPSLRTALNQAGVSLFNQSFANAGTGATMTLDTPVEPGMIVNVTSHVVESFATVTPPPVDGTRRLFEVDSTELGQGGEETDWERRERERKEEILTEEARENAAYLEDPNEVDDDEGGWTDEAADARAAELDQASRVDRVHPRQRDLRPSRVAEQPVLPQVDEQLPSVEVDTTEINLLVDSNELHRTADAFRTQQGEEIQLAKGLEAEARARRIEAAKFAAMANAAVERAEAIECALDAVQRALAGLTALGLPTPRNTDDVAELKRYAAGFERMAEQIAELGGKLTAAEAQVEAAKGAPALEVAAARDRMSAALRSRLEEAAATILGKARLTALCTMLGIETKGLEPEQKIDRIIAVIFS
jgi:hypothetical protein